MTKSEGVKCNLPFSRTTDGKEVPRLLQAAGSRSAVRGQVQKSGHRNRGNYYGDLSSQQGLLLTA